MTINVLSNLALNGSLIITKDNENFPENPSIGTLVLKEQVLYAYITVGGLSTWYPFSTKTNSYIHSQGLESSSWLINHGLGTTDVWYQVQDIYGNIMMPSGKTAIDSNSFYINFSTAVVGKAIIVAPQDVEAPYVKTSLINVANSKVVIDSTGIQLDGEYLVAGASGVSQETFNAEVSARIAADTTLQASIDALGGPTTQYAVNLSAGSNIDLSSGVMFYKTITQATAFTVSNVPATGEVSSFILDLTNGGQFAITWFDNIRWSAGEVPTLTATGRDILGFLTRDNGANWIGSLLGKDVK